MRYVERNLRNERGMTGREERELDHRERMLDEALEQTFPASDPISVSLLDQQRT